MLADPRDNLNMYARHLEKILLPSEVETLSKLPSREELLVKFLFLLKAPVNQFVSTLNEVPSKFIRILATIRDSKK